MKWSDVYPSSSGVMETTSTTLLRNAVDQLEEAWRTLVLRYSRVIYRWCRQSGLQSADAANITQDVLRTVVVSLGDFQREHPGAFRGWLKKITFNKIRDWARAAKREVDRPIGGEIGQQVIREATDRTDSTGTLASDVRTSSSWRHSAMQAVERVKAEVSERDWKLFWRVAVDGQSAVDVGTEFGVSANAVRLVKMRLLRRLRIELGSNSSEFLEAVNHASPP